LELLGMGFGSLFKLLLRRSAVNMLLDVVGCFWREKFLLSHLVSSFVFNRNG
jgi:hypothetical protein